MIRKWDIPDELARKRCIDEVIARVDEQGDAVFGVIAAQEIIDIVGQYLGPVTYNKGISDATKVLQTKMADLEVELDVLKAAQ